MTEPYYQDDRVTLYHGDCREITEWLEADVLVTDPPYGIPGGRLGSHRTGVRQVHADADWDSLEIRDEALALWGDRPRAVFGTIKMHDAAPAHRGVPLVWDKGDSPGMGDYTWPFGASYELVWINGDGWTGPRRNSVLRFDHSSSRATTVGHPTPKPVGLMESIVKYAPSGTVADPFAGSGSTLVAAKQLGRAAVGVELEERYCEVIAKRLAQPSILTFRNACARAASEPSDTHQPHATTTAWMRADR